MPLSSTHPEYDKMRPIWIKLRDVYAGEEVIKAKGMEYLKPTAGMRIDGIKEGQPGYEDYMAYLMRANFPDMYAESIANNHGLLWSKEPTINLPAEMEYLRESATRNGLSLLSLLSLIHEMQLREGRIGLLLDFPEVPDVNNKPFISVYYAMAIRNWDKAEGSTNVMRDSLNMLILDESCDVLNKQSLERTPETRYRFLTLGEVEVDDPEGSAVYRQALFVEQEEIDESQLITPVYKGTPLTEVPFVVINASDCLLDVERPPLLGLANMCLSMYRSDADYRQHLHLQTQDTLVVIGSSINNGPDAQEDGPRRIGSGAVIETVIGGDAKFIGVESKGLEEERLAIQNDRAEAQIKAGQMVNNTKGSQESGEALRTRIGARTASLVQLAKTGAKGLEDILKICARWMGCDATQVSVIPNLDFSKALFSGQNLVQTLAARNLGAPLSLESIHSYLVDQGITKLPFEQEMELIKQEIEKYDFLQKLNGTMDQNPAQHVQGNNVDKAGIAQQPQK